MTKEKETWSQITKSLERELTSSEFRTWFTRATLKSLNNQIAVIEVPNKFFAAWLEDRYIVSLRRTFKTQLDYFPEIRFTYPSEKSPNSSGKPDIKKRPRSPSHQVDPSLTFDNFIIGKCNRFAYSSSQMLANNSSFRYSPLFIFGQPGQGKTHLLHAIGNHIFKKDSSINLKYVPCEQFSSHLSSSVNARAFKEFLDSYLSFDLLLFDDVDLLAGKPKCQEQFISLLNHFCCDNRRLVVTGKVAPAKMANLNERLTSRLAGGLLAEIHPPDQELKIRLIKNDSAEQDLVIPDDVVFFLANTTSNINFLRENIIRLVTYGSFHRKKIDIQTVKSILKNRRTEGISFSQIQRLTADYFNIAVSDLLSNKKKRSVSYPRQLAMYLCRELTNLSFKEIGGVFGNKDHSTVIHAVKRIDRDKNFRDEISEDLTKLRNLLT
jgi:chromosomal replication initiator protein